MQQVFRFDRRFAVSASAARPEMCRGVQSDLDARSSYALIHLAKVGMEERPYGYDEELWKLVFVDFGGERM